MAPSPDSLTQIVWKGIDIIQLFYSPCPALPPKNVNIIIFHADGTEDILIGFNPGKSSGTNCVRLWTATSGTIGA